MSAMRGPSGEPEQRWSLLDDQGGLPEWTTSPTFIFVCVMVLVCIVVPGVLSAGRSISSWWAQPKVASVRSDCVGVDDAPSDEKLTVLDPARLRGEVQAKTRSMNGALHQIEACPIHNCAGSVRADFQRAMRRYLGARVELAQRLNRHHGEVGLKAAHRIFSEPGDARIVAHLEERYRAGDFSPEDVGERKAIARWMLERPEQPIRLCPRR